MTNWKLTLAYDGSPYSGWQIQPNLPTVQGLLSDAIHRTTGERVLPQGSGRTDAGVHALAQVASFTLNAPIPAANLHRALNRCLPPSIRVLAVEAVPPTFHARHSALRKTYEYRIFPLMSEPLNWVPHSSRLHRDEWEESICPPTLAPTVWPCPWPLDLDALNQAAAHVLGTHDFTSFAAADPDLAHRSAAVDPDLTHSSTPQTGATPSTLLGTPSLQAWPSQTATNRGALAPGVCSLPPGEHSPIRTITHSQWRAADSDLAHRSATVDPDLTHSSTPQTGATPSTLLGTPSLQAWPSQTATNRGALAPGVCSLPPGEHSSVRTITHSQWRISDGLLIYRVTADGFLHHMVRNLVGTFVQAGAHRLSPDSIAALLAARDRTRAGPTAPASGLFLVSVEYA